MNLDRAAALELVAQFQVSSRDFRELLAASTGGFPGEIVRNQAQVADARAELITRYTGLERVIHLFGNRPQTSDGVWNVAYSPYGNAFSADVLSRVFPSIDGVLDDLNVVRGRIQHLTDREFRKAISTGPQWGVPWAVLQNSLKPLWVKIAGGVATLVLLPLLVIFLAHTFGWSN